MKRSNAPIFWLLFGAGGMLAALAGVALVWLTGIGGPLAIGVSTDFLAYERALAFARHPLGSLAVFVAVALFLWHAAHRIFHSLHDVGIHAGTLARLICYGGALAGTLAALLALVRLGGAP